MVWTSDPRHVKRIVRTHFDVRLCHCTRGRYQWWNLEVSTPFLVDIQFSHGLSC
jgi:hypothetical protein